MLRTYGNSSEKLYAICTKEIVRSLELEVENNGEHFSSLLGKLAVPLVENIMVTAYENAESWNKLQSLFLAGNVNGLIIKWDLEQLKLINDRCRRIKQVLIVEETSVLKTLDLLKGLNLLSGCSSVDFDGELFWRGRISDGAILKTAQEGWLSASQRILRCVKLKHSRVPKYFNCQSATEGTAIVELHLGDVTVTVANIEWILKCMTSLFVLKSYKLVEALYKMHLTDWKSGKPLPRYHLRNLDADFSYVGRSTLSVGPTLHMDALQLAVMVCEKAESVRVRFDCSSHHDILQPLISLRKLKEFSLVCVSNGEYSLLNFEDVAPILKHHGSKRLRSLELKVIEEVDTHALVSYCTKVESLVLSGCTYSAYFTRSAPQCSCHSLPKLKTLFYVESDDTSNNNNYPPQCFWLATLTGDRLVSRLTCLCLKSPRIMKSSADQVFNQPETRCSFPALEVFSIYDYYEFALEDLISITRSAKSLRYVRISQCDRIAQRHMKRWREQTERYDVTIDVD